MTLAETKNDQRGEIKGNKRNGSKEQKNILYKIEMLYKSRNKATKFSNGYFSMLSAEQHEKTKRKGLKIVTPKQML